MKTPILDTRCYNYLEKTFFGPRRSFISMTRHAPVLGSRLDTFPALVSVTVGKFHIQKQVFGNVNMESVSGHGVEIVKR